MKQEITESPKMTQRQQRWNWCVLVCLTLVLPATQAGCVNENGQDSGTSLLDGEVRFDGEFPELTSVTYSNAEGEVIIAEIAFAGWVTVVAASRTAPSDVEGAIAGAGGAIIDALPRIGIYTVEVRTDQVPAFVAEMLDEPWLLTADPTAPLAPQGVHVIDLFWTGTSDISTAPNCSLCHGCCVARVAARHNTDDPPATPVELYNNGTLPEVLRLMVRAALAGYGYDLPEAFYLNAHTAAHRNVAYLLDRAATSNDHFVINISEGPVAGYFMARLGGGEWNTQALRDWVIRSEQTYLFELGTILEAAEPEVRDRVIIVVSSGNGPVDLTPALRNFQAQFPDASSRIRIVGGIDLYTGEISEERAHGGPLMFYAPSENVRIAEDVRAHGTSYAAPEVARVIDLVWDAAPTLTSTEILQAFQDVIDESYGGNPIFPSGNSCAFDDPTCQETAEATQQSFIDRVIQKASGEGPAFPISFEGPQTIHRTLAIDWDNSDAPPQPCESTGMWSARIEEGGAVIIDGLVDSTPEPTRAPDGSHIMECRNLSANPDWVIFRGRVLGPSTFEIEIYLWGSAEPTIVQGNYSSTYLEIQYDLAWDETLYGFGVESRTEQLHLLFGEQP